MHARAATIAATATATALATTTIAPTTAAIATAALATAAQVTTTAAAAATLTAATLATICSRLPCPTAFAARVATTGPVREHRQWRVGLGRHGVFRLRAFVLRAVRRR